MIAGIFALLSNLIFFTGYISNKNSFEKPLSKDEELTLLKKIANGDVNAKNELAKHNLRLVVHIMKKYASYGDNDELISVGNVGLVKAINTFDYNKQTIFATYAAKCIENEILMCIRANKKYREVKSLYDSVSLDKDGNEVTLMDVLSIEEDSAYEDVEKDFIKDTLMKILDSALDKREYEILCLRYGLRGNEMLTQNEIAKKYRISRSYVSRIESKALKKMKKYIIINNISL